MFDELEKLMEENKDVLKRLKEGGPFAWYTNAKIVETIYGGYVDWEERFYNCPECSEPIYECDWTDEELKEFLCPVCEFAEGDGEL